MTYIIERNYEIIATGNSKEELLDNLDKIYDFTEMETDEEIVELDGIKMRKSVADEIIAQREKAKEDEFKRNFFETHLGWVRREAYFAGTGKKADFLTQVLPQLTVGFEVLTYNFMATEQYKVAVDEQFIAECKQQLVKDFYPTEVE